MLDKSSKVWYNNIRKRGNTMKELLDANLDYYELQDLKSILKILVEDGYGDKSIAKLLEKVKEIEETY